MIIHGWLLFLTMVGLINNMIKEGIMLEEIRKELDLSIEDFVFQMDWPNSKYYGYIKNGRKRPGREGRQVVHPTIFKIFTGINNAIGTYPLWANKNVEITAIVIKHIMPSGYQTLRKSLK